MSSQCLNQIGLVTQLIGAAYLVAIAFLSRRTFSRFNTDVTYGELGAVLGEIVKAQRGQFGHQLIAFALLALGTVAQLMGS